jgi:hypothetical protein
MYAVSATIAYQDGAWHRTYSTPTFYLDERAQGIVDEDHARRIAVGVIDPTGRLGASLDTVINITAVKL